MLRYSVLLTRLDYRLPARRTNRSAHADALMLATGLAFALVGVVPSFAFFVQWLPLPLPFPALLATGFVLASYVAVAGLWRRPVVGTFAALCVLSTFAADMPFGPIEHGLRGTPGFSLWLFELPLVVGLAIAAIQRWDRDATLSRIHWLFAGFVVWAFVSAVFGAGPRPVVAATYAFHFLIALVVFVLVAAATERDVLGLRTVVGMLVVAVCAQATFAVAQLLHGRPFSFSRLGETGRFLPRTVTFGPLEFTGGAYLSGFAGATHALVALALLIAPLTLAIAVLARARRLTRVAAGVATVCLYVFVVLSTKSSARGAAFLAIIVFLGLSAWTVRRGTPGFVAAGRRLVAGVLVLGASLVVLLSPSQRSGSSLNVPERNRGAGGSGGSAGGGASSGGSAGGGASSGGSAGGGASSGGSAASDSAASTAPDPTLLEHLEGAQIPLFDLGSFGIRAQQYISAVDVAFRHPLFGLGGANFPYIGVTRYGLRPAHGATGPISNSVHNAYLSVLASTGVPGFVLFCATLAGIAWASISLVRTRTVELWVGLGVFCALSSYLAYIFWDITFISSIAGTIPFWILAGAVVGTYSRLTPNEPMARPPQGFGGRE